MDGVFSAACRLESRAAATSATEPFRHEVSNRMPDPAPSQDNGSGGGGGAARRGLQQLLRSSTGLTPSCLGSRSSSPASSFRRQASMAAVEHVGGSSVAAGGSRSSSPAPSYRRQASMSAAAAAVEGRRSGNGSGCEPSSPASSSYRRQASMSAAAAAAEGRRSGNGSGPSSPAASSSFRRQASSALLITAAEMQSGGSGGEAVDGGGGNPRSSCSRLAMAQLMASFDSQRRYVSGCKGVP